MNLASYNHLCGQGFERRDVQRRIGRRRSAAQIGRYGAQTASRRHHRQESSGRRFSDRASHPGAGSAFIGSSAASHGECSAR